MGRDSDIDAHLARKAVSREAYEQYERMMKVPP